MSKDVLIYARTSLKIQPINNQVDHCIKYAQNKSYNIVGVFLDEGYSTDQERPGFNSLLEKLEENKTLTVVVYHIDRLYKRERDAFQSFQFKYHLESVI